MSWKDLRLGKKLAVGFGVVLALLLVVSAWALFGMGEIIVDVRSVGADNDAMAELRQREIDHLNWAGKLSAALLDPSSRGVDVELDPHKCGFGKWYYSDERKGLEAIVPSVKGFLQEIEDPHKKLHETGAVIARHLQTADGQGRDQAREVFAAQTTAHLGKVKDLSAKPSRA